jgi:heat shock protein HspQ
VFVYVHNNLDFATLRIGDYKNWVRIAGVIRPTRAPSNVSCTRLPMRKIRKAKYAVGQVVRHRFYAFRGIIFDIDPVFNNTESWWLAIPEEIRPRKDQPFYHLLAENSETEYIAYVSEQNLMADRSGAPLRHPGVSDLFLEGEDGKYRALFLRQH